MAIARQDKSQTGNSRALQLLRDVALSTDEVLLAAGRQDTLASLPQEQGQGHPEAGMLVAARAPQSLEAKRPWLCRLHAGSVAAASLFKDRDMWRDRGAQQLCWRLLLEVPLKRKRTPGQ